MDFKTGSICSKHDDIMRLAQEIGDLADKCKDDGCRMEAGLVEKRKRIEKLEAEVDELKEQLSKAEDQIGALQDENQDLAAQLKAAITEAV